MLIIGMQFNIIIPNSCTLILHLLVEVLEAGFGEHPPLLDSVTQSAESTLQYLCLMLSCGHGNKLHHVLCEQLLTLRRSVVVSYLLLR